MYKKKTHLGIYGIKEMITNQRDISLREVLKMRFVELDQGRMRCCGGVVSAIPLTVSKEHLKIKNNTGPNADGWGGQFMADVSTGGNSVVL